MGGDKINGTRSWLPCTDGHPDRGKRVVSGQNIPSCATGFLFFERCQTTPGKPFSGTSGSPLFYERPRSPHMVNIPRALLAGRTGRQPLYHIAIEELQEWAYTGEPLVPLKGFPGVVWQRSKKKKPIEREGMF